MSKRKPRAGYDLDFDPRLAKELGVSLPGAKAMLTPAQAARVLGITPLTLSRWLKCGRLPATRDARGHWQISSADLEPYLRMRASPSRQLLAYAPENQIRKQFARVLDTLEVEAAVAATAQDARLQIGQRHPSAFVLPAEEQGWALAEKIRTGESFAYAAILMYADRDLAEEDLDRALRLKLQGFLRLPATDSQIAEAFGSLLASAPRTKVIRKVRSRAR